MGQPASQDPLADAAARMLAEMGGGRTFSEYRDDPIGFFRNVLKIEPWEGQQGNHGQADVIRAVAECDRVGVKSGHKVSKSNTAAGLSLWFVATREGARATLTAPTFNQVRSILWRELRNMERNSGVVAGMGTEVPLDPATGIQLPNGNEIRGVSTRTPENLAGISSPEQLYVIDEASGFPDELWTAIQGNTAGGAKILAISNPTKTTGWYFGLFRRKPKRWRLFTISSENTPNVVSGERLVPGIATRDYIEEMREECGPDWQDHPTYMVRVAGEFPPQGSDVVVSLRAVERAVGRWAGMAPGDGELVLGVDPARFGDDMSAIQPVRGRYGYAPQEFARLDGPALGDRVIRCARELRIRPRERVRVNIDGIGVGASVVDYLRHHDETAAGLLYIIDVNVGEVADDEDNYVNLRSQLWFGIADWLKTGALPPHDSRDEELLAPLYGFDSRGRKVVESKKVTRKTLGRSPNFADALNLAVYRGHRGAWDGQDGYESGTDHRHSPDGNSSPRRWDEQPTDDGDDDGGGGLAGGFF